MKTNKTMRAASVLLIAVLMTTCAISGTFAKYTSSATGSDSARVAYWGFGNSSLTINNLFSNTYTNVNGSEKVVAPGTTGKVKVEFKYDQNGSSSITAPEVAYKVDVNAEIDTITGSDGYEPIKWALTESAVAPSEANAWKNAADFETVLSNTLKQDSVAAGSLPNNLQGTYYIHWKWDFDDASTGVNDTKDTALGNAATLDDVEITLTVKATQID